MDYREHLRGFQERRLRREGDPRPLPPGGPLAPALVRSLQRFQVGESGDGAGLVRLAELDGAPHYAEAVRLFVAEEQEHARLLAAVLAAAGEPVLDGHWSERVFVGLRRALGLRLELVVLTTAEVVALRYYRALRDGGTDPLLVELGRRVLADEQHHVPFHVDRLEEGFARTPVVGRLVAALAWWGLMAGAALVVAVGHGAALRRLGVPPARFFRDVLALFRPVVRDTLLTARRDRADLRAPSPAA
jgi:hypothetical protein